MSSLKDTLIPPTYPELEAERLSKRDTIPCPPPELGPDEVEIEVDGMFAADLDIDVEFVASAMVDDAIPDTQRSGEWGES